MIKYFNNPFRYSPHPLVIQASKEIISRIDKFCEDAVTNEEKAIAKGFSEGKMLGVLIAISSPVISSERSESRYLPLFAFSGSVGNHSIIEGFVPPIYDLLDPDGHFKIKEAEITRLNKEISELQSSEEYNTLKAALSSAESERDTEIEAMRSKMAISKQERARRRADGEDSAVLTKESQFEKAELKRLKTSWETRLNEIRERLNIFNEKVSNLKTQRAAMSDELQEWIFKQYRVHNALGEESSIYDIFSAEGLTPPGGTGDCAATKLLEYAYRNNLKPLAMGEFWYGTSPDTAVRTHGHFYPSCTSKCGPLLGYMMRGLELDEVSEIYGTPVIIYEDDSLIAVSKPSGMPSVPGLDGRQSVQEWLNDRGEIHAVHRLDMDTSGVLLFAKTTDAAVNLRKQFEAHSIKKTYIARLCPAATATISGTSATSATESDKTTELTTGTKGRISLPLSPDYDERPRQKADFRQGKEAITDYEVLSENPDGTIDIAYYPITGRTHQLRVHSAHHLGLGRPILGDLLYGGCTAGQARLHLHAQKIEFVHPESGQTTVIDSSENRF